MKRFCILMTAILLIVCTASSQSYSKLWKEVTTAQEKDLPQTALLYINKIISLARSNGDSDQLFKALVSCIRISGEISADSAQVLLPAFESELKNLSDQADISIYHAILGWLYLNRDRHLYPTTVQQAFTSLKKALENPQALAQVNAQKYLALTTQGKDSHYYNNDMLSVIFPFALRQLLNTGVEQANQCARIAINKQIEWYSAHKMAAAEMLSKIDSAKIFNQEDSTFYSNLIVNYSSLPIITKAYLWLCRNSDSKTSYHLAKDALKLYPQSNDANAFKNIISKLTRSQLNISLPNSSYYPGDTVRIILSHRNLTQATLRYYKLPFAASDHAFLNLKQSSYTSLAKNPSFVKQLTLSKGAPYEDKTDTINFVFPNNGIYLVEAEATNCHKQYDIMHISQLGIMQLPLPDQKVRICVVDYHSGTPIKNAAIKTASRNGTTTSWRDYTCNSQGELILPSASNYCEIYAYTPTDKALLPEDMTRSYAYKWNNTDSYSAVAIFTDRAIYRPGQIVKIGGFTYNKIDDSTHVMPNSTIELEICNANGKRLETITTVSDDMGAFGVEYHLPQDCLNGTFSIRNSKGYKSFMVQEYKRPNFQLTLNKPNQTFTLGDTISIHGQAKTYSGFPLANTKIICATTRALSWWWRSNGYDNNKIVRDTVTTDAQGAFCVRVAMSKSETDNSFMFPRFYTYTLTAKATDIDGETQEATLRLYAGNTKAIVTNNVPSSICQQHRKSLTATQINSMGERVSGSGKYILFKGNTDDSLNKDNEDIHTLYSKNTEAVVDSGDIEYNLSNTLDFIYDMPTGEYTLVLFPSNDTNTHHATTTHFTLFSTNATKPVSKEPLVVWNSESFQDGKPVDVIVSTGIKNGWIHYDLMADGKLIESQLINTGDTILHYSYSWRDEYGKGLYAQFAVYHDGQLYSQSITLPKPTPKKQLQLKWTTFRDKLTPGAEETWTIQVLHNGKPQKASLLATLYDASLNKFARHSLPFSISFNRFIPSLNWVSNMQRDIQLSMWQIIIPLKEKYLSFTTMSQDLFGYDPFAMYSNFKHRLYLSERPVAMGAREVKSVNLTMDKAKLDTDVAEEQSALTADAEYSDADIDKILSDSNTLRSNFNETAFFAFSIHTDQQGEAKIQFKLPDGLTQWSFQAIAHTQDMHYGTIDTLITVSKPLMVHANTPRFLRSDDKGQLALTLRSNSSEQQSGIVKLVIIDPQNGSRISQQSSPFSLRANGDTLITFPITATKECPLIICRYATQSKDFTDGEQKYIPVLSDMQRNITSVPFVINDTKPHSISLEALDFRSNAAKSSLTIEYTGNPAWTAIEALPSNVDYTTTNATGLAINYSALAIMRRIINNNPQIATAINRFESSQSIDTVFLALENNKELKQILINETPWEMEALNERSRIKNLMLDSLNTELRLISMLHKLQQLQTASGGWQWFSDMPTSTWLTLDITEMLMRTCTLCPETSNQIMPMITRAMLFLDKEADNAVQTLKKYNIKTIPTLWMRYLYVASLCKQKSTQATKYMLNRLNISAREYNMYDKAMAACVLQMANKKKEAEITLRSLMQHTVKNNTTGRYFDSSKAPSSQSMYRIPTQIAAIEALQLIMPEAKDIISDMKLWLLQSKHTQTWDSPLASSNAILCILGGSALNSPTAMPSSIEVKLDNGQAIDIYSRGQQNNFVQLGYIKGRLEKDELTSAPKSVEVQQSAATMEQPYSFGAAYLQKYLPTSEINATSSGLALTYTLYRETSSGWQQLAQESIVTKGDKIKIRYDIHADRDYDFISLKDGRPACLEPTNTLSAYDWQQNCYRNVQDASTTFFFSQMPKGHHTLETTYVVDRDGEYNSACPQLQCQYAPEFCAYAKAYKLHANTPNQNR